MDFSDSQSVFPDPLLFSTAPLPAGQPTLSGINVVFLRIFKEDFSYSVPYISDSIHCISQILKVYFPNLNFSPLHHRRPAGPSYLGSMLYFKESLTWISDTLCPYISDSIKWISQILKVYFPNLYFSPLHHCRPAGPSYLGSGSTRPNSAPLLGSSAECWTVIHLIKSPTAFFGNTKYLAHR